MTVFQKIACLIFRLVALGLIFYASLVAFSLVIMKMPQAVLMLLPALLFGVILYWAAKPLAWLVTQGFEE